MTTMTSWPAESFRVIMHDRDAPPEAYRSKFFQRTSDVEAPKTTAMPRSLTRDFATPKSVSNAAFTSRTVCGGSDSTIKTASSPWPTSISSCPRELTPCISSTTSPLPSSPSAARTTRQISSPLFSYIVTHVGAHELLLALASSVEIVASFVFGPEQIRRDFERTSPRENPKSCSHRGSAFLMRICGSALTVTLHQV